LVGAVATVLVSIVNAAFAYVTNQRGKRNEDHLVATKEAVETLKIQTNGISEKLLQVTGDAERAKGVLTGHAEAKADADADALKCQFKASDDSCRYPGKE
jgi:meiotically up-regulated gene 157 (Mug157) protein